MKWLRARGSVAIGYSGGVDSAYLAAVAVDALGRECVTAVIGRSESYPESQWQNARDVARLIGVSVVEVDGQVHLLLSPLTAVQKRLLALWDLPPDLYDQIACGFPELPPETTEP